MKLVFAHDHKLREIEGKYYTTGDLRDSITDRYFKHFDELTIFCRSIPKQSYDTKLFAIKNPSITVNPVSNGFLILSKSARKTMEETIRTADGVIVKLPSFIAEYAIHYARKYNIPYLVESVSCPWDAFWNHSFIGKLVAPFITILTKKEIRRAPYVIYVTKEFLERRYPTDGKWIDCSDVELKDVEEEALNKRLAKIERSNSELVLGTLAHVDVRYKGQEYVIRTLGELKKQGLIFKYKLAGGGDNTRLSKIAEKYGVSDQIEFCGVLPHDEVFSWLDDIDFYIQPSKQEGLPRSLVEAISRACPAAGSTAGGIGELIDKEFIFDKGNVKQIVSILSKLDKEILKEQAKKNFENAKNYQKDYLDQKRSKFYEEFAKTCFKKRNK